MFLRGLQGEQLDFLEGRGRGGEGNWVIWYRHDDLFPLIHALRMFESVYACYFP